MATSRHHDRSEPRGGISALRSLFFSLLTAGGLLVFVTTQIVDELGAPVGLPAATILTIWVVGLVVIGTVRRRPLEVTTAEALARSYRTQFFVSFICADAPLIASVVISVLRGELWPVLVGGPAFAVSMLAIWPGRHDVERRQRQITAQGSPLQLIESL